MGGRMRRLRAHGHHHVEEGGFDLDGGSAHFVDEIDVHDFVRECTERVHDEVRVERDDHVASFVIDDQFFAGFADVGGDARDNHGVFGEGELHRMVAIGFKKGNAAESFDERLAFNFDAFTHFGGDDLLIVWVGAINPFGDEADTTDFEADVGVAYEEADIAFVTHEAGEFGDAFERHDELAFVAFGELEIDIGHREATTIGSDNRESVFAEGEEEAVENVA